MKLVSPEEGRKNLESYFVLRDRSDTAEARSAYPNYHEILFKIAAAYRFAFYPTVAAFCALSPNSDYQGNLRSLVSVLDGLNKGVDPDLITVSTYNHCKFRAVDYLKGVEKFDHPTRGLKVLNFYKNIIYPWSTEWVTIDGHIAAAYQGDGSLTMKDVILTKANYEQIAQVLKELANDYGTKPCIAQATIWFIRKRVHGIKYDANFDMFVEEGNHQKTLIPIDGIKPYGTKQQPVERPEVAGVNDEKLPLSLQQTFLPDQGDQEETPLGVQGAEQGQVRGTELQRVTVR